MKGEIPMNPIERITQIPEEIWHDMCGEDSSYEVNEETILHSSQKLPIDDRRGETDSQCS